MHVFIHEACHAAISKCVPWIHDLDAEEHTAIDEITARLLENEVAPKFSLSPHTPEEHVSELAMYPIRISVEQYRHICSKWQKKYWPEKDLEAMAKYIYDYLFKKQIRGDRV